MGLMGLMGLVGLLEVFDNLVSDDGVFVPLEKCVCQFLCCDGTSLGAVGIDEADDGLATFLHFLRCVGVDVEGNGKSLEG